MLNIIWRVLHFAFVVVDIIAIALLVASFFNMKKAIAKKDWVFLGQQILFALVILAFLVFIGKKAFGF